MATLAHNVRLERGERDGFFAGVAIAMALTVAIGFSLQILAGRSTFRAPPIVHLHAVAFMGWVALFTLQAQLGAGGETPQLHRRLGWVGAGWAALLVVLGCALTVYVTRLGFVPFFFRPQYFLIANLLGVFAFAGFTWAAVRLRRRTDWHRRLHICGMSMIMGPGIGRILPLPFMGPHAFDIAAGCGLLFIAAGMIRDQRRFGRVHPAWRWGAGVLPAVLVAATVLAWSPIGDAIYRGVTSGSPGAGTPGLGFGTPPPGLHAPD